MDKQALSNALAVAQIQEQPPQQEIDNCSNNELYLIVAAAQNAFDTIVEMFNRLKESQRLAKNRPLVPYYQTTNFTQN